MTVAIGVLLSLAGLALGTLLGWKLSQRLFSRRQAELERALDRAQQEIRTDVLTGLGNRKAFDERLDHWMAISRRYSDSVSLILFDLDAFKQINDQSGHAAGDAVLAEFAGLLRKATRASDFSARVGGDEFAILLPHTDAQGAHLLAERIRHRVETLSDRLPRAIGSEGGEDCQAPGATINELRVSAGIAQLSLEATPAQVFEQADLALYRAKKAGGNRVETGESDSPGNYRSSDSSSR